MRYGAYPVCGVNVCHFMVIGAAYVVRSYLKGHFVGMMLFIKGAADSKLMNHSINSRRSTELEIIGVDDHIPGVIWMLRFLRGQGFKVNENILYQDNQSAILMEENRKYLCGNKNHHIDMSYFFITNSIKQKEFSIKYFPTEEITG